MAERVRGAGAARTCCKRRRQHASRRSIGFAALPHAVVLHVFSCLPADERARAAVICRAWRAAVAEPSLWTRLDLSPASGVRMPVTDAVLRGAAALARGGLKVLILNECEAPLVTQEARLEVVAANSGSLRQMSCYFEDAVLSAGSVEEMVLFTPS